jgi:uncharacterized protein YdeI (YjbR/CyaY-like superfamily)
MHRFAAHARQLLERGEHQALQAAGQERRRGAAGPRGVRAARSEEDQQYSFERKNPAFDPAMERAFKANPAAWAFFRAQPAGYQRLITFYVMSAKQESTRLRRLDRVAAMSAKGERLR